MRMGLLRIDHALSSPDLVPVALKEDCSRAGDHCILEAWYSLTGVRGSERDFEDAFPAFGDIKALPVTFVDRTGLVTSIELGHGGALEDGVSAVAGRPSSLEVSWTGGMCDQRVEVAMLPVGATIKVGLRTERAAESCLLAGIGRSVILNLERPIEPSIVEFEELP